MRYFAFLTAAVSLAALPVMADTVTIGTVEAYDAGGYTVDPAALQGFEKALGDALCQRAGFTCDWKVLARDGLWRALAAGEIDAVMAAVPANAELGDGVDRTMAYLMPDPFLHIGLAGTEWVPEGAIVAHLPDPDVAAFARTTGSSYVEFDTQEAALAAVRGGQVLSLFGEREALAPLVGASGGELAVIGKNHEMKIRPGLAMALGADNIDLRFAFEDQIFAMSQDGSLNALTEAWFGTDAARW